MPSFNVALLDCFAKFYMSVLVVMMEAKGHLCRPLSHVLYFGDGDVGCEEVAHATQVLMSRSKEAGLGDKLFIFQADVKAAFDKLKLKHVATC